MPDSTASETVSRFASDLRRVRELRGITTEDLHNETKIPASLLESFETTGLLDHPMFNRVYLRSFVRSYAEVVGIAPDEALAALDEVFDGTYRGRIAVKYLGEAPPPEAERPAGDLSGEAPPAGGMLSAADTSRSPAPARGIERDREAVRPGIGRESDGRSARKTVGEVPDQTWLSQSPPPGARSGYGSVRPRRRRSWQWLYLVGFVAALAAIAWFVLSRVLDRPAEPAPAPVAADTTQAAPDTAAATPAPAPAVALGDTLRVTIVAANGKVEGIRVKVDQDDRRPYWLEQDSARTFMVRDSVVIQNQLSRIKLQINGREYPTTGADSLGRLVINRARIQSWLSQGNR